MTQNTFKPSEIVRRFRDSSGIGSPKPDYMPLKGKWRITVTRADGSEEEKLLDNVVLSTGMDALASRGVSDTTSPFTFLAIGTVTAEAAIDDTVLSFGEVDRKAGSIATSSNEVLIVVATWAGDADTLTGVVFGSAAAVNHVNSGQGVALNIVNSVDATLADSDFLKVQLELQVGSHNV